MFCCGKRQKHTTESQEAVLLNKLGGTEAVARFLEEYQRLAEEGEAPEKLFQTGPASDPLSSLLGNLSGAASNALNQAKTAVAAAANQAQAAANQAQAAAANAANQAKGAAANAANQAKGAAANASSQAAAAAAPVAAAAAAAPARAQAAVAQAVPGAPGPAHKAHGAHGLPKWKCLKQGWHYVPIRVNEQGEVECMSYNGRDCVWSLTQSNCKELKPLQCGEAHKKQWGNTGYDHADSWCARGQELFGKRPPTAWKCLHNGSQYVPIRKNAHGEVECMSADARHCTWVKDEAACKAAIAKPSNPLKPLACGAEHKKEWGNDGYGQKGSWCAEGKTKLSPKEGHHHHGFHLHHHH